MRSGIALREGRAERRRRERARRLLAYAALRLDRVTAGDKRKQITRAYDAVRRGLITKRQARRLGVTDAALNRVGGDRA